jgi:hypothetical protein
MGDGRLLAEAKWWELIGPEPVKLMEQTIEPAIGSRAAVGPAPPALRREASCSRFLHASSKLPPLILIDATPMRIARRKRCCCLQFPEFCLYFCSVLGRAASDRRSAIAIRPRRYRKAGMALIPTWQFASASWPTPCRSTNAGASSHPGGIASTASS